MSTEKRRLEAKRWLLQAGKHAQAAQQAGEKALKGFRIAPDLDPWGHSLARPIRGFPEEEAHRALEDARAILEAVEAHLGTG